MTELVTTLETINDLTDESHTFVIIGKRETGKTTLANNIVMHLKNVHSIEETTWFDSCGRCFEHCLVLEMLKKRCDSSENKPMIMVVDNVIFCSEQTDLIETCVKNAKSLNIFLIITLPYPIGINPTLKFDVTFASYDNNAQYITRLYNNYFNACSTFESFESAISNMKTYQFIVKHNTNKLLLSWSP